MSKLPNHSRAVIDRQKITGYLLSKDHPLGGAKARFFANFGFSENDPETLERALLRHAGAWEVNNVTVNEFGTKFSLSGPLETPSGRTPAVTVVWFIQADGEAPHLVTAFPA